MLLNKLACVAVAALALQPSVRAQESELVRVPGQGKLVIVNACGVPTAGVEIVMKKACELLMIDYEIKTGSWSFADAKKAFDPAQPCAAVFIVKDKALPISLVAMESKWGVVNADGLDEKSVAKETLRVAAVVLGGAASRYKGSAMRPVFSADDLATKAGDFLTLDSVMAISNCLPDLGIRPYRMMSREDALELGLIKK